MTDGIRAVTMAPGQAAAAQADVWAQNTQAAKSRYKANVGAVSLSAWQQATIDKGVARVAGGASAAEPKYAAAAQKWYPIIGSAVAALPARGNIDQNIVRAAQLAKALHAAKG